ncbi:MAG: hypothetical protein R2733_10645 [Acidimicrobiales bacterium]
MTTALRSGIVGVLTLLTLTSCGGLPGTEASTRGGEAYLPPVGSPGEGVVLSVSPEPGAAQIGFTDEQRAGLAAAALRATEFSCYQNVGQGADQYIGLAEDVASRLADSEGDWLNLVGRDNRPCTALLLSRDQTRVSVAIVDGWIVSAARG